VAAVPMTKLRRSRFGSMFDLLMFCHGLDPPHVCSGAHDGALDSHVGHAAAEIAVHVRDEFWLWWDRYSWPAKRQLA